MQTRVLQSSLRPVSSDDHSRFLEILLGEFFFKDRFPQCQAELMKIGDIPPLPFL